MTNQRTTDGSVPPVPVLGRLICSSSTQIRALVRVLWQCRRGIQHENSVLAMRRVLLRVMMRRFVGALRHRLRWQRMT